MNNFLRPIEYYTRNIDVLGDYMKQTAIYLNRMTGKSMAVVTKWLKKEFSKGGKFEYIPPMANITVRDPQTGDRKAARMDLATLMEKVRSNGLINSPSLTFYIPPHIKRSLLSEFIDENIKKRGIVKKEMFAAQAAGDELLATNKKNAQNSFKTRNNALSGAHSSAYTILYNKSTHSALTSLCRTATSYGNAGNEKLLGGSRHYWMPGIVINNILSTLAITDYVEFEDCMIKYNLHYPTVEETMEVIKYSTTNFWENKYAIKSIKQLVESLSDLERASFVYIGDLYHIRKFNDSFMRDFVGGFFKPHNGLTWTEDDILARLDGDTTALVSLLRMDVLSKHKEFSKIKKNGDEEGYRDVLATIQNIYEHTADYALFINAIMNTRNVPTSIARLPDTIRRIGLVSDTDSTMASAQGWSTWYTNGVYHGKEADDVADTMIYIATQNIAHLLGIMSGNMGVEQSNIHRYSMKNEFKFSAFALTNKAKHYFSIITSQEGVLKSEAELEVKGVALRTSNIPPAIMDGFRKTIYEMSEVVASGELIDVLKLLKDIADIEREIERSVKAGEYTYLKTGQIKSKEGYAKPDSSIYAHYEFWEKTFGRVYGTAGEPSYGIVKLSVELDNKTKIKDWLNSITNPALNGLLTEWFRNNPKKSYTYLALPEAICSTKGIPQEILDVANYRRIIFSSVEPYYHMLECLGLYLIDDNRTKLVSDYY